MKTSFRSTRTRRAGFTLVEVSIAVAISATVFVAWLKTVSDLHTARLQDRQVIAVADYLNEHVQLFQAGVTYQNRLPQDGLNDAQALANVSLPGGASADSVQETVVNEGDHLLMTETVTYYLVGVGQKTMTLSGIRY